MWVTHSLQAFVAIMATRSYRLAFNSGIRDQPRSHCHITLGRRAAPASVAAQLGTSLPATTAPAKPTVATAAPFRSFFLFTPPPPAVLTSAQHRDNNLYNRRSQQFVKKKQKTTISARSRRWQCCLYRITLFRGEEGKSRDDLSLLCRVVVILWQAAVPLSCKPVTPGKVICLEFCWSWPARPVDCPRLLMCRWMLDAATCYDRSKKE